MLSAGHHGPFGDPVGKPSCRTTGPRPVESFETAIVISWLTDRKLHVTTSGKGYMMAAPGAKASSADRAEPSREGVIATPDSTKNVHESNSRAVDL